MLAIFLVVLFFVALTTTQVIHRFISIKRVPWYVYISAWIGWFMCFSIIILVPIDIIATSYRECLKDSSENSTENNCSKPLSYLSESELYYIYQTFYFGTLILTWLVYPLLQSYVLAGDFHVSEKIQTSIKENVYLYLVFGVIGLVIMIWLLAVKKLDWNSMMGFVMAAANTWGLLLVIMLMGYGLVETPRSMWLQSNRELILKHLQFKAVDLLNSKKKYGEELYSTLKSIKKMQEKIRQYDPYEKYINTIVEQCPEEYNNIQHGEGTGEITYAALVSLNARLKKDLQLSQRAEFLYEQCVMEAFELQDVMSSTANESDKIVHWSFKEPRQGRWMLLDKFIWVWYRYLEVSVLRLTTIFFALLSLLVIWSEISVSVTSRDVSILSNIVKHSNISNILIQVAVFLPLGYEALTTYSTLFKMRIFNYYRLIPHQHSDSNSIIFSAAYLCRLAAPLCFNYITFIQTPTVYSQVMGTMDVAPFLGTYFYIYFPLIIIIICLATLFNLFSRILNFFNVSRFRFDTDFNHEQIDEGKFLLESERRKWVNGKSILSSSLSSSNNSISKVTGNNDNNTNTNNNSNNGGASEQSSRFSNTYSKYSYLNKNSGFKGITTSTTPTTATTPINNSTTSSNINSSNNSNFKTSGKYTQLKDNNRDDYDRDIESAITYNSNFSTPTSSSPNNSNGNKSGFPSMDKVFGKNRYSQLKDNK